MSGAIDYAMAIGALIAGTATGCFLDWLADNYIKLIDNMTEEK